jgi:hypothetical protein
LTQTPPRAVEPARITIGNFLGIGTDRRLARKPEACWQGPDLLGEIRTHENGTLSFSAISPVFP